MTYRKFLLMILVLFGATAQASQIQPLPLTDLSQRTEAVALASVVKVESKTESSDEVTIKVALVLKGSIKQNELRLTLIPRGVKGFDPILKVGDTGVFFLKEIKGKDAKLAYWGSVAVFPIAYFETAENEEGAN